MQQIKKILFILTLLISSLVSQVLAEGISCYRRDGVTDNEDPELNQFYYHSDHLGSSSYITNLKGSIVQHIEYVPFGEVFIEERNNKWNTPYLFNGKELDEETGLYYYGARYYSSRNSIFLSVDPLWEAKPSFSPYNYCSWNPVMRVDPDGRLDDWVENKKTGEYEWMDNVTSVENTPEGYRYVGSADKDILTDLNLPSEFSTKTDSRTSFGLDGDNRSGAPIGTKANVSGNIKVNADVVYDKDNVSDNNVSGKTFKGVTFEASFKQSSKSSSSDLIMKYKGYFGVQYGDKAYSSFLKKPTGTYIYETGTNPLQAKISISSSNMNKLKVFKNAYISVGVTNPSLFISPKPIKLSWNLMRNSVFLPKQ